MPSHVQRARGVLAVTLHVSVQTERPATPPTAHASAQRGGEEIFVMSPVP